MRHPLGLDHIDWRAGEIVVAGKGPRDERFAASRRCR